MKISKRLLIGLVGLSLSLSVCAVDFKDKLFNAMFVAPAKVMQLQAQPELQAQLVEPTIECKFHSFDVLSIHSFKYDYGGDAEIMVNSNSLSFQESNVFFANFAVKQNQNFERMASAS